MTAYCPSQDQHCNPASSNNIAKIQGLPKITFSSMGAYFQQFRSWYVIRRERKINRDAFQHLLKLDDQLLDDVGVTRDSVRWAASLPLSEDAAEALESTTKRGRRS